MQIGRLYVKRGCNEERESNVERGSEFEANFERVFVCVHKVEFCDSKRKREGERDTV